MDYFEHKLAKRLVLDPGPENPAREEDRFYAGFDETIMVFEWVRTIRLFWRRVADHSPRAAYRPEPRKEFG